VRLGYPGPADEVDILGRQQVQHPVESLKTIINVDYLLEAIDAVKHVHVSEPVKRYAVDLVNRTRQHEDVYLGASPRGSLGLFRVGQVLAALEGRKFVLPDDVKKAAVPVLAHRVILGPEARLRELTAERIVQEILESQPVPGGDFVS
ncbi:MAG: MoxR family ATPase, partial [Chloroflexota bacterium]